MHSPALPLAALAAVLLLPGCAESLGIDDAPDGCAGTREEALVDDWPFGHAGYRTEGTGSTARSVAQWAVAQQGACSAQSVLLRVTLEYDTESYQQCPNDLRAIGFLNVTGNRTEFDLAPADEEGVWKTLEGQQRMQLPASATGISYTAGLEASLTSSGGPYMNQLCMKEFLHKAHVRVTDRPFTG